MKQKDEKMRVRSFYSQRRKINASGRVVGFLSRVW